MYKILAYDPAGYEPSAEDWSAFDEAPLFRTEAEATTWLEKWPGNITAKVVEFCTCEEIRSINVGSVPALTCLWQEEEEEDEE